MSKINIKPQKHWFIIQKLKDNKWDFAMTPVHHQVYGYWKLKEAREALKQIRLDYPYCEFNLKAVIL